MPLPNIEIQKITVKGRKDHFMACWKAVQIVIQNEIASVSDAGFLMEIMGDMARFVEERKNDEPFKISMPFKKWRGVWHCLNICAQNKMFKGKGQLVMGLEIQSLLAIELDKATTMEKPPLELIDGGK